ncbi:cutinase family protein [Nocardia sp. CA2R105]|uniref:cutinase family protein n=1 Tax=Nocardia coffeae TaxID=2873381 RepID=UPI001CA6A6DF|nr:cutinase family protein [Nocardia coffeae]MBY8855391.1 cutinase family protein [Nocardia coffeae]
MSRFRTRTATAAVLGALGASLLAAPADAAPTSPAAGCPVLWVLAVQGTGQSSPSASPTADTGVLGTLLGPVVAAVPNLVQRTYIPYPAGFGGAPGAGGGPESYTVSVTDAIRQLDATAGQIVARCPATELAVVGYSQGAQAVSQFARDVGAGRGPVPANKVAAVALYADPERKANSPVFPGRPGQSVPDAAPGTSSAAVSAVRITAPPAPGSGIAADNASYGSLTGRVADICVDGDLACAAPEHAALLRVGAEIAAQADLSNPVAAVGSLQRVLSSVLGSAWATVVLDDVRVGPATVDYLPAQPLSQRLIAAADPRIPAPAPERVRAASQRWGQITTIIAAHPGELPKLASQLAAAWGQLVADEADLTNPAVWASFAATVTAHDGYAATGQLASGIAWLVAAAHDLAQGEHR